VLIGRLVDLVTCDGLNRHIRDEVLREVGFSSEQINYLRKSGIV
jgi:hypothetical protein